MRSFRQGGRPVRDPVPALADPRIARAILTVPGDCAAELVAFYGERLELPVRETGDGRVVVSAGGGAVLDFVATDGRTRPFHHFALLVPGDRFDAAYTWLATRGVDVLGDVVDFTDWEALACYFHDPAENIVELIAHRGIGEGRVAGTAAAFSAHELLGLSEVGLVCSGLKDVAGRLRRDAGLVLWDGSAPEDDHGLAFVGRRAHTLILSPPGRGWMPTRRLAEPHAAEVTLVGADGRAAMVAAGPGGVRITP